MTREDANKTLKENLCAMCAYGSQNMDSCDIRSCDNRDAIKALEQETNEDCVSRRKVEKLKKWRFSYDNNTTIPKSDIFVKLTDIRTLPPVKPTRKKGKWRKEYFGAMYDTCSECGQRVITGYFEYNYCPNCGAEMESEENDKEESGNNEKK